MYRSTHFMLFAHHEQDLGLNQPREKEDTQLPRCPGNEYRWKVRNKHLQKTKCNW